MVDLGFLLITFFIVTTTWALPKAMHLNMPADGEGTEAAQSTVLTLVPLDNDRVFFYQGSLDVAREHAAFGVKTYALSGGIGDVIRSKQAEMDRIYRGGRKEMVMLIKPTKQCNYKNVVQLLDESLINKVGKYALVDMQPGEEAEVEKLALQ
jgi:biopolymer transport protein ExbD